MPAAKNIVSIRSHNAAQTSTSDIKLPKLVKKLRDTGWHALALSLNSFFQKADDHFFELSNKASGGDNHSLYFELMRSIRVKKSSVIEDMEKTLNAAFDRLTTPSHDPKGSADQWPVDELSLINNEELEEQVALNTMVNLGNNHCGESLQHLTLRLDNLLPVKVYQKNNPFAPETVCHAFIKATKLLECDIKARLMLCKLFEKSVVVKLDTLCEASNEMLARQNILPSLKQDLKASKNRNNTQPQDDYELPQAIRQLLTTSQEAPAPASRQSSRSTELMNVLSQLQQSQPVIQARLQLQELIRAQNQNLDMGQDENNVINLVGMLFEFILDDRTLPATMKALLGRMQIPLIKVALSDRTFFSQKQHPARKLLNEMATAALGWQESGRGKDKLQEKMESIVYYLLSDFDADTRIFDDLLTDFTLFLTQEQRRTSRLEQRMLEAERKQAQADAARKTVDRVIQHYISDRDVPAAALAILEQGWKSVMFLTALNKGTDSAEWKVQHKTIHELVWSVTAPMTPANRSRLQKLSPQIGARLKAGLESIAFDPFQRTDQFKALKAVYVERIKAAKAAETVKAQPAAHSHGVDTSSVDHSAIEFEMPSRKFELVEIIEPEPAGMDENDPYLKLVDNLVSGAWFDMQEPERSFRCRLAAVLKAADKYIFVNRTGMKVAEKSRLELADALRDGQFTQLDDGMLFDRALKAVIADLHRTTTTG
ncbi:DUF1631 domain-containing protein [Sansalvadorimonas verongulae]|uniref:DUF1631 domain-containing protein n=1 Tax=Sansalvadorimonas verongulae TaxID=2172824 RepID=UPI0018AD1AE4|nr:DUF1631 domain-containing protein [Sansalvadorimonas verongulae]